MAVYARPNTEGSPVQFRSRYDHWIGGEYVPPASGQYFENVTPVTGQVFCEVARGNDVDIDRALDAAHAAAPAWGRLSVTERIRRHAVVEPFTIDNGLMTATQKIKRHLVRKAHAEVLAKLGA